MQKLKLKSTMAYIVERVQKNKEKGLRYLGYIIYLVRINFGSAVYFLPSLKY